MEFDCITNQAQTPKDNSVEWGTTQIVRGGVLRQVSDSRFESKEGEILRFTIFEDGVETIIIDVDKDIFIHSLIDQYGLSPK